MPCSTWNGATVASDTDPRPARGSPGGEPSGSDGDPPESIYRSRRRLDSGRERPLTITVAASGAVAHHERDTGNHPPPPRVSLTGRLHTGEDEKPS